MPTFRQVTWHCVCGRNCSERYPLTFEVTFGKGKVEVDGTFLKTNHDVLRGVNMNEVACRRCGLSMAESESIRWAAESEVATNDE